MKQLSHLLQRITPNLAVILLGLFFILGSDENYPIITILDDNPAIIKLGDVYTDAGATAKDKQDGKVDVITTGLDAIDTSIAKHYTVTYTATDSDKNISIATRLVKVIEEPVTIEAPKNLNASAGDQQITLTWDDVTIWDVTGADKYTIYRAEETGITPENYSVYKGGTILDNKTSPFVLTGLENGKTYYFVVTASKGTMESKASNEVFATPIKVVVQPLGRLNDTGITRCADNNSNDLDCPVSTYPNQDAQSGRDATHNDDSDGRAGFSFTKISSTGSELPVSATQWSCVKDNVTGLIWEVKTDDGGLRDKDIRYTWYNPDKNNNGGYAGTSGGNTTNSFVTAVNAIHLCGYSDWRMPSREELRSIINLDRHSSAIDSTFFPNTAHWYWSSSSDAENSSNAWFISTRGRAGRTGKKYSDHVRLVHSR